ncbi:MAG: hypothetical protein FJZ04_01930 [Candidatus Moranbacteria bacterium]|nr:hypothetical protein [Candidatus Moranbacteria bacterium]
MQRNIKRNIFSWLLLLATFIFLVVPSGTAQAAKVTKWQRMLEQNGIDRSIWQKYLPKITRKEYNKAKKIAQSSSGQTSQTSGSSLGPEISVGLWYFDKSGILKVKANKSYNIKNKDGNLLGQVTAEAETKVAYDDDGKLKVSGSIADTSVDDKVTFDATDGDNSSLVFDVDRPGSSYDHYRGKIEANYYRGDDIYNGNGNNVSQIWVINELPMEHYVWGMGETTGTGPSDHVRVMATIFRSYGYWYYKNATKYKPLGFKIRSDAGSQIYRGYDWETKYPNIRKAAEETRGQIVVYDGEVALTPYCSYTDGKTRSLKGYSYLKSVKDHKKGKKKGLKPGEGGNHMWGVSAHGALGYAEDGKSWAWILKHYYTGVDVKGEY